MIEEDRSSTQSLVELKENNEVLCLASENIFDHIIEQQGKVVIVNGTFLVKGAGKVVGMCLRDIFDEQHRHVFKKGSFYAPIGQARDQLMANFGIDNDQHKGSYQLKTEQPVLFIPKAQWVFLRSNHRPDVEAYVLEIAQKLHTRKFFPNKKADYDSRHEPLNLPPYSQLEIINQADVLLKEEDDLGIRIEKKLKLSARLLQVVRNIFTQSGINTLIK